MKSQEFPLRHSMPERANTQSKRSFSSGQLIHPGKLPIMIMMFLCFCLHQDFSFGQVLSFPTRKAGISTGNSKEFSGLRINLRDHQVNYLNGINITFWKAKENETARMTGLSLGVLPEGGYVRGIQLGLLGVGADQEIRGLSMGLLGVGSRDRLCGLAIGGLGVGAGSDMKGIIFGGLGAGSGEDMKGVMVGGLGAGAGKNMTGVVIGGLGAGAGENLKGIILGGLGAGAGKDLSGFGMGLLGVGAGENLTGIAIAGLGAGCGGEMKGLAFGGVGAGAPTVKGVLLSSLFAGGKEITGVVISGLNVRVPEEGYLRGFSASAFNFIKGNQTGVTIGLVNYCWHLNGVQLGIINYVKDNPPYARILPLVNAHFD